MRLVARRHPLEGALIALLVLALVALATGMAQAATLETPSPSAVSASESAIPSAPPADTGVASPERVEATGDDLADSSEATSTQGTEISTDGQLAVGIDRWIKYPTTATTTGQNATATASLAVPRGLVPSIVRGTITSIADNPGTVRVRVGANTVTVDATTGGPFSLQVPTDAVIENTLTLEIRTTLSLPEGDCVWDFTTSEELGDLEVGFIGRETPPTTIAGFFSPPVNNVIIVSPTTEALSVADATISAASAMASRYPSDVSITVVTEEQFTATQSDLLLEDGLNRVVRIAPTDESVTNVKITNPGVPTLTISGPTDDIAAATGALASTGLGLAAVPEATELTEERSARITNTLTFADLGADRPTVQGLGRLTYTVPVAQTRFGGPVGSFRVRMSGAHTPIPSGGGATASILWNNELVDSQLLELGDEYAVDVTIDGSMVRRDNLLTLRVDASAPGGNCSTADRPVREQPVQLDINGALSTIEATPGQTLSPGFLRFPQAFGDTFHIAFGSGPVTPELVAAACSLVISLQRTGATQFDIEVHDFAAFVKAAFPGMVVGATPADANALQAPLRFEQWRLLNVESGTFAVTVDGPFAALEGFETNGRNLLMLGGTEPVQDSIGLMGELAESAATDEFGWFALNDDLLIAQPEAELLSLNSKLLIPQETVTSEGRALPPWWLLLVAAVILLILLRAIWGWTRRRRVRRRINEAQGFDADEAGSHGTPDQP